MVDLVDGSVQHEKCKMGRRLSLGYNVQGKEVCEQNRHGARACMQHIID